MARPERRASTPGVERLLGGLEARGRTAPYACLSGFDAALAPHCTLPSGPLPTAAVLCPCHVPHAAR